MTAWAAQRTTVWYTLRHTMPAWVMRKCLNINNNRLKMIYLLKLRKHCKDFRNYYLRQRLQVAAPVGDVVQLYRMQI